MNNLSIHLVSNLGDKDIDSYLTFVERTVRGGVSCVQLREKRADPKRLYVFALRLKALLKRFSVPLIVNDDVSLAHSLEADGVHLGQQDGCPVEARRRLGPGKIIGLSVENETQIRLANHLDCIDYVGCGAIFSSKSKSDCAHIFGVDGLKRAVKASRHPVVAIGGIDEKNAGQVFQTGCAGIAIIAAIHESETPETLIKQILSGKENAATERS